MRSETILLFDLDGTVTDPRVGITRCVAYALERFGIHVADTDSLTPFIGPPLEESFMKFYGFSRADAKAAVAAYRERFGDVGLFENAEYPGMAALLRDLTAAGRTLALATSKPEVYARRILDHFGYTGFFTVLTGSELSGERVRKAEVIACALERLGFPEKRDCLMIGDREHDVLGARENSLPCVGVLYGYGSRAELSAAGADALCESVAALRGLLLG